ncbi:MAG: DUF350 domain-containing protein [Aquificae bacterium]|nr:DUF350 domain-containing protein [Aquificota bacterium]
MSFILSAILAGLWLWLSKLIFDSLFYPRVKVEEEIFSRSNKALALSYAGFLLALSVSFLLTFVPRDPFREALNLSLITLLLFSGVLAFDTIALRKVNLREEVLSGNTSAGLLQGTLFISVSLITSGAYWARENVITSLAYSLVYTALGLSLLWLSSLILSKILRLDFQSELLKDNTSASLVLCSILLGVSLVVFGTLSGEYVGSLLLDILLTLLYFAFSQLTMIGLYVLFEFVVFRRVLLSAEILSNNAGASITLSSVFLASAFITLTLM